VVSVDASLPLEHIDAEEARRRLVVAGVTPSLSRVRRDAPTEPLPVLR